MRNAVVLALRVKGSLVALINRVFWCIRHVYSSDIGAGWFNRFILLTSFKAFTARNTHLDQ